jgi:hypothetical protein
MTAEQIVESEIMWNRFRRLLAELTAGVVKRNSFQAWEVELLLDFQGCRLEPRRRLEHLRQYERAVGRQLSMGQGPPMKLSEFLQLKETRRPMTR